MGDLSTINQVRPVSAEEFRAKAFAFERAALKAEQVPVRSEYHFGHKVAAKTIYAPANTIMTGRIHLFENLNMLVQGEMEIATESGIITLIAPCLVESPPGTKRVVQTITDCIWMTIIGTSERDPDKIEALYTVNDEQEYLALSKNLVLEEK